MTYSKPPEPKAHQSAEHPWPVMVLSWGLCALFVALAIIGVVKNYSPVPYWDMWDGYLGFYQRWQEGGSPVWWAQHNEHRILLARLLFWADLRWSHGSGASLLALNLMLLAGICLVFQRFLQTQAIRGASVLTPALMAWLFSWAQQENLVWAFQCQFIMAQLLPLAALYLLQGACQMPQRPAPWRFAWACILGLASIGTMANGVLILPLMTVFAAWARMDWRRTALLAVLAALGWFAYFHGYVPPAKAEATAPLLPLEQLLRWAGFFLCYLGGPFKHILSALNAPISHNAAGMCMGSLMLLSWGWLLWRELRAPTRAPERMALLVFILFVFAGGAATTLARSATGLDQSSASRYSTPALMAWAALWICIASVGRRVEQGATPRAMKYVLIGVLALCIPLQMRAKANRSPELFERALGALAVELDVRDQSRIERLYPSMDAVLSMAGKSKERRLSVFGVSPLLGLDRVWTHHEVPPTQTSTPCSVRIERIEAIEGQPSTSRIGGVAHFDSIEGRDSATKHALIVRDVRSGQTLSIALFDMGDALEQLGAKRRKSLSVHFSGYTRPLPEGARLAAQFDHSACTAAVEFAPQNPALKGEHQ